MQDNYPEHVALFLNAMDASLQESGFYTENEIQSQGSRALHDVGGPILLQAWLENSLEEISDDTIAEIMRETLMTALIYQLQDKGMLDTITDEKGAEIIFVTEQGKDYTANHKPGRQLTIW